MDYFSNRDMEIPLISGHAKETCVHMKNTAESLGKLIIAEYSRIGEITAILERQKQQFRDSLILEAFDFIAGDEYL
jgi:poly(A) polymerase Pap1